MSARCHFVRKNGERCKTESLPDGSWLCLFHSSDPERVAARTEGRRAGGIERMRPAAVVPDDDPDAKLHTVADVAVFLADTMNRVRKGKLNSKVGSSLGFLAGM